MRKPANHPKSAAPKSAASKSAASKRAKGVGKPSRVFPDRRSLDNRGCASLAKANNERVLRQFMEVVATTIAGIVDPFVIEFFRFINDNPDSYPLTFADKVSMVKDAMCEAFGNEDEELKDGIVLDFIRGSFLPLLVALGFPFPVVLEDDEEDDSSHPDVQANILIQNSLGCGTHDQPVEEGSPIKKLVDGITSSLSAIYDNCEGAVTLAHITESLAKSFELFTERNNALIVNANLQSALIAVAQQYAIMHEVTPPSQWESCMKEWI